MARVAIIGTGAAGLSAAIRLADLGHDVAAYEQYSRLGGVAPETPVTFTLPAVIRDLFRSTGRPLERELDISPIPHVRHHLPDGTHVDLPHASRTGTQHALEHTFGAAAAHMWADFLRYADALWQRAYPHLLNPPFPRSLIKAGGFDKIASHYLPDPRVKELALSRSAEYGFTREKAPELAAIWPYLEQTFGVWSVPGGLPKLLETMASRATTMGARIHLNTKVVRISNAGRQATGVVLSNNQREPAGIVITTASALHTHDLLPRHSLRRREPTHFSSHRTRIKGIYRADSGTHPGPGLPMSFMSANVVANLIGRV